MTPTELATFAATCTAGAALFLGAFTITVLMHDRIKKQPPPGQDTPGRATPIHQENP